MIIDNDIDLQLTTHLSLASVPFFTITFKLKGNTKRSVNTRNILTVNWDNRLHKLCFNKTTTNELYL